jgi:hypothetical protein
MLLSIWKVANCLGMQFTYHVFTSGSQFTLVICGSLDPDPTQNVNFLSHSRLRSMFSGVWESRMVPNIIFLGGTAPINNFYFTHFSVQPHLDFFDISVLSQRAHLWSLILSLSVAYVTSQDQG